MTTGLGQEAIEILRAIRYYCPACIGNPMVSGHNEQCITIKRFQQKLKAQD